MFNGTNLTLKSFYKHAYTGLFGLQAHLSHIRTECAKMQYYMMMSLLHNNDVT